MADLLMPNSASLGEYSQCRLKARGRSVRCGRRSRRSPKPTSRRKPAQRWTRRCLTPQRRCNVRCCAKFPRSPPPPIPRFCRASSSHAVDHLREIKRLFGGGAVQDFAFVRAHARLRAEQRFPLEATLHAYRCGHRVVSRWLRDAAAAAKPKNLEAVIAAIADFSIEYTDAISIVATAEYVAHTRLLAEAERDLRSELLGILLNGYDESDARVAQVLRRAGYLEQRLGYCVAVAQSVNAAEMERPARAQRVAAALEAAVAGTTIRTLTGARDNLAIAIFSDRRRVSGWTAADGRSRRTAARAHAVARARRARRPQRRPSLDRLHRQGPERGESRARFCRAGAPRGRLSRPSRARLARASRRRLSAIGLARPGRRRSSRATPRRRARWRRPCARSPRPISTCRRPPAR